MSLDEVYFVPSLLFNAIKGQGYNNPAYVWHMCKRPDGKRASQILRGFFKRLKPALLAHMEGRS